MGQVRGVIYNLARYKQPVDFSGLQFERGITPTDIDGAVEFGGRLFIFFELKFRGAAMSKGQRLYYERLCGARVDEAKVAVIVAHHCVPAEEQIDAASAIVSEYFWGGCWRFPAGIVTLRSAIEKIRRSADGFAKVIPFIVMSPPDARPRTQSDFEW